MEQEKRKPMPILMNEEERNRLKEVSIELDKPMARVVRSLIKEEHRKLFGEAS